MKKVFSVLFLILFLATEGRGYFSVRTNPPPVLGDLKCDCTGISVCTCSSGAVSIGVSLDVPEVQDGTWLRYAQLSLFGETICDSPCIGAVGRVTSISVPFMKHEILEEAQKTASIMFKKNMSLTERVSYFLKAVLSSLGIGTESDEAIQLVKEKTVSSLKQNAERTTLDMTSYLVHELAKDMFVMEKPSAGAIALAISELSRMANEGKLASFLAFWFYARARYPELLVSTQSSKKSPIPLLLLYNYGAGKFSEEHLKNAIAFSFLLKKILQYGTANATFEKEYAQTDYRNARLNWNFIGRETFEEAQKRYASYDYERFFVNPEETNNLVDTFMQRQKFLQEKLEQATGEQEVQQIQQMSQQQILELFSTTKNRISNETISKILNVDSLKAAASQLQQEKDGKKDEGRFSGLSSVFRRGLLVFQILIAVLVVGGVVIMLRKKKKREQTV